MGLAWILVVLHVLAVEPPQDGPTAPKPPPGAVVPSAVAVNKTLAQAAVEGPAAPPSGAGAPPAAAASAGAPPGGPPQPNTETTPAAPPPGAAPGDGALGVSERDPAADTLSRKASQIRALLAQTLDPEIDAESLLTLDGRAERDAFGPALLGVLDFRAPRVVAEAPAVERARAELAAARQAFLSQPEASRRALLVAHAERRRAWRASRDAQAGLEERVARLEAETATLRGLADGTLSAEVDPIPLLTLDLTDPLVVEATRRVLGLPLTPPVPIVARQVDLSVVRAERRALDLEPVYLVGPPWLAPLALQGQPSSLGAVDAPEGHKAPPPLVGPKAPPPLVGPDAPAAKLDDTAPALAPTPLEDGPAAPLGDGGAGAEAGTEGAGTDAEGAQTLLVSRLALEPPDGALRRERAEWPLTTGVVPGASDVGRKEPSALTDAESAPLSPSPPPESVWDRTDERLRRAMLDRVGATLAILQRPEAERAALLEAQAARLAAAKAVRDTPAADDLHKEVEAASAAAIEASKQAEAAQRAADLSAKQRAAALEAARVASDEVVRAVATETARLLGVQQDQATFRARVLGAREALNGRRAAALDWRKRVGGLTERADADEDVSAAADTTWPDVVAALDAERGRLEASLTVLGRGTSEAPEVGPSPVDPRYSPADQTALESLHGNLVLEGKALAALEQDVRWEQVDADVADMLHLDAARLGLIAIMSDAQRRLVTGFGPQGIQQVVGALQQVQLLVRYRIASGPRLLGKLRDRFVGSPFAALSAAVEILVLALLIRWWRRSGPELLTRQLETLQRRRRPSAATRATISLYWYVRQLHGPLSWLLLLAAANWVLGDAAGVTEVHLATLIASWLVAGSAVVQLIDGVALRANVGAGDRSAMDALRLRSLRLVGRTVVLTGLLLSLTATAVGEGAIYHWMVRTAWLLVIPVQVVLVGWWREVIFAALTARTRKGRVLLWAERVKDRRGLGNLAAAVVGARLMGQAFWRWASGRLTRYTFARRVQAWLFRRQLSLHEDEAAAQLLPLSQPVFDQLDVKSPSAVAWPVNIEAYQRVERLVNGKEGSVTAVVGDLGMGKSHFLGRVCQEMWQGREVRRVACPVGGWDGFAAALAESLGGPPPQGDEELEALIVLRRVSAIAIDDAHRLARPVIGGLRDLDRLMALTRRLPHRLDWVLTFTRPSWQFISRARGSRPQFDEVVILAPWDERDLAGWLEARALEAGFTPNYDALALASDSGDGEPSSRSAYARRSYFRLLWDYTDGNPGVALYFWRASLSGTADGSVLVRLFEVPDSALIAALPTTLHFVLRVTVQLELAVLGDIVDASGLWPEQVADAVRHLVGLGYLERAGDRVRVPWRWVRAVNVTLNRQHLLVA